MLAVYSSAKQGRTGKCWHTGACFLVLYKQQCCVARSWATAWATAEQQQQSVMPSNISWWHGNGGGLTSLIKIISHTVHILLQDSQQKWIKHIISIFWGEIWRLHYFCTYHFLFKGNSGNGSKRNIHKNVASAGKASSKQQTASSNWLAKALIRHTTYYRWCNKAQSAHNF